MPYNQLVDVIPMFLAAFVILKAPSVYSRTHDPKVLSFLALALVFVTAQSSWVSSWIAGDTWGRDWANWVWAIFNTGVMGVFIWTLSGHDKRRP